MTIDMTQTIRISKESLDTFKHNKNVVGLTQKEMNMKNFIIDVDFTFSGRIEVEAENEQQARMIFEERMKDNPYIYGKGEHYISHSIIDINEEEGY